MTRKVSVDSVADTSADDLLRFLYDLAFRQPTPWGWAVAGAFAAIPGWMSIVSFLEGKTVSGAVFGAMCAVILGLRFYMLRRVALAVFKERKIAADETATRFDIDG